MAWICMQLKNNCMSNSQVIAQGVAITYTSSLQPSTAITNQLPGHWVSTQIRTIQPNYFIFIIILIVSNTKVA